MIQTTERDDLLWLAGYLEGEGCFLLRARWRGKEHPTGGSPGVIVHAVDEDVIARAAALMRTKCRRETRPTTTGKAVFCASVGGDPAIALMNKLLPFMGQRRSAKIKEILAACKLRPGCPRGERVWLAKLTDAAVREIRQYGQVPPHGYQSKMARKYGVSQASVWYALKCKTWRSVA